MSDTPDNVTPFKHNYALYAAARRLFLRLSLRLEQDTIV